MALPSSLTLYKLNDQYIQLDGLADDTGAFINSATVLGTLYDKQNHPVAGATALSFTYVALSDGTYKAAIPETFDPPAGSGYSLDIDADDGAGTQGHWEIDVIVQIRKT